MRFAPLLALLVASSAPANVLMFNDGGIHDVDFATETIRIAHGTTVNVLDGAVIVGASDRPGVIVDSGSTLNVLGGQIRGLDGDDPEPAVRAVDSTISLQGGTITGGATDELLTLAGAGIDANRCTIVTTGGTVRGGAGPLLPGFSLLLTLSEIQLAGGEFRTGEFLSLPAQAEVASLAITDCEMTITGGTVEGRPALFLKRTPMLIAGGTLIGDDSGWLRVTPGPDRSPLTILAGEFISPDGVEGIVSSGGTDFRISGGDFQAVPFGRQTWRFQGTDVVTITGTGLIWEEDEFGAGPVTGELANGDDFDVLLDAEGVDVRLEEPVSIETETWSAIKAQHR